MKAKDQFDVSLSALYCIAYKTSVEGERRSAAKSHFLNLNHATPRQAQCIYQHIRSQLMAVSRWILGFSQYRKDLSVSYIPRYAVRRFLRLV